MIGKTGKAASDADKAESDAAWQRLTKQTTPLAAKKRARRRPLDAKAVSAKAKPPKANAPKKPQNAPTPPPIEATKAGAHRVAPQNTVDKTTLRRLKSGEIPSDALNLHYLTQAEARAALHRFIGDNHRAGKEWLKVITGRGKGGAGVLRKQLPHWLSEDPLAAQVAEYGRYQIGAEYYIRLRKREQRR